MLSPHRVYDIVGGVVIASSLAYTFLPSWESFNDYPTFQRWYKFAFIFIIKLASFNGRNLIHPEIRTTDVK
jgi:hypothetical protein